MVRSERNLPRVSDDLRRIDATVVATVHVVL
jgi:hypothetical protein